MNRFTAYGAYCERRQEASEFEEFCFAPYEGNNGFGMRLDESKAGNDQLIKLVGWFFVWGYFAYELGKGKGNVEPVVI